MPHLIVKKDGADKVEHMHVVTAARRAMAAVVMAMMLLFPLLVITKTPRGEMSTRRMPRKKVCFARSSLHRLRKSCSPTRHVALLRIASVSRSHIEKKYS